jgi:glucose/arabinose dehydrogenase
MGRLALAIAMLVLASTGATAQPRVEVVARGLETPWALAFAPDGRLFVTERPGRLRVVANGRLAPEPVATLTAVVESSESGLMGLALDPGFATNGRLYVCYTLERGGRIGTLLSGQSRLMNRISRLTLKPGGAPEERVLLDGMPGGATHDGCRLKFGPDGKLYATMGDARWDLSLVQKPDAPSGKVLRINADGSIPADNPFPGQATWSLGHRNPQGLAWDRQGRLLAAEHGPSAHDEVNHVVPGGNYGWPDVHGKAGDARFRDPILESGRETWAPSGIAILGDDLYVACLRGRTLVRARLGGDLGVSNVTALLDRTHGRLRDVVAGPDGALYVTTSNRDGRGSPAADDDRILRVVP